ncbi:MAG: septation regulator SpoVG [Butyricicoccus sp.]|nr:septation regulator SpoVG [Butyricicoccus sp.]MBQ8585274.1 septation regulator SpoVG [Butyricicoccus sp.]
MEITDIKFRRFHDNGRLRALVSITFDNTFAVHDIKVIDGDERLFLAMPSRRMPDGHFRDIVHPVGSGLRRTLEDQVLRAYLHEIQSDGTVH